MASGDARHYARRDDQHIPVIVVHEQTRKPIASGMRRARRDTDKPIDAKELLAKVRRSTKVWAVQKQIACVSSRRDSPELREAQTEAEPTRAGVQAGSRNWLLSWNECRECCRCRSCSGVPLHPTLVPGPGEHPRVLASVVDFAAFNGREQTVRTPDCRLLLIAGASIRFSGTADQPHARAKKRATMQPARRRPNDPGSELPTATEDGRSGTSGT